MSDEPALDRLRHLHPGWTISRDVHGVWRAAGRTHVAASSVHGLVDAIGRADSLPPPTHRMVPTRGVVYRTGRA
ncbi:hypothetical protein [Actinomadura rifamycini]|uniref:hypothetical protein n=1 Tax=Actinomadura rifamycini TaxID=31962 RepID=UPI000406DEEB|nr:hypothetical protein [Actinomadura rifamycini]